MAAPHTESHTARYRQIASALARHGMGYMVGIFGLERFVPFHTGLFGHKRRTAPYTGPEHIRMALEDLGPTFIKLGQILSTRADLLPPDYLAELSTLQDAAPSVPWIAIEEALVAELGRPIGAVFAAFEREPLATASIGQAYAATLPDGTEVVVKVRRPGVVEQIEEDLGILQDLAATAVRRWEPASRYDLVGLDREFAATLRSELDYIREGRDAERFAALFANDSNIHIPRIFWEATTARVLTMERIRGIKITDLEALDAAGIDRKALAERSARIILKMVFEDGFFHADPHPGNFFIEEGGRIGLIDFGMVGMVDERTMEQLATLLVAITGQDSEELVDAFLDMGAARGSMDRPALTRDLERVVSGFYGQELGSIQIGALLTDTLAVVRRNRLVLPASMALLTKALVMNEGMAAQLDPTFNLASVMAPFAQKLLLRRYSPLLMARYMRQAGLELARWGAELPHQMRQLRHMVAEVERVGLRVGVRLEGIEPLAQRLEKLANRVVVGILASALIVSLAVLMSFYHPAGWEQWAGPIFALGFAAAIALGLYLAWSILRSGRK